VCREISETTKRKAARTNHAVRGFSPVCRPRGMGYIWTVATSSFTTDEIRAAAETHRELPPEYQNAVIESFLAKVDREIDARVDARLAMYGQGRLRDRHRPRTPALFALATMVAGIPLSAIAVATGQHPAGFWGLLVVWVAIVAINVAYIGRFKTLVNERN
jgi:hypothetical protein